MPIGPPITPTSPAPLPPAPLPIAPPILSSPPAIGTPLNIFPSTPSISWSVSKAPNWATRIQRSVSGKELRVSDYVLPIYTFTLTYEILRDPWDIRMGPGIGSAYPPNSVPYNELRVIWGFFNQQFGAQIPFMFFDQSDHTTRLNPASANTVNFNVGDGITTSFQMASALRAPVIPFVVNSTTLRSRYTIDPATGIIYAQTAPSAGVFVGADMQYYYRVRFAEDFASAENFAYQFWQLKTLKLVTALD